MTQEYKRKTRNFFIKKDFQGRMILAVFLTVIISCLFFITIFALFSADTMTISYQNSELKMGQTPAMLFKNAIAANWLFLIICATLLVFASIIGTHRIAGPMFRFEKTLESMISRNLNDSIHLRDKDEGKELAAKINDFNKTLSKDLHLMKKHSRAINDLISQFRAIDHSSISIEDVNSICNAIQKHSDKLHQRLSPYQLADEE
jgi:methyl-accepting chemotaxis protein